MNNKIFFHYKCSYKLSAIIQKMRKVIQKLSIFFNRSRKIQKNPEKSQKNLIFSCFFLWSQLTFCIKQCYHLPFKNNKKMSEKKVEKKVIFIFANFFFKIHFGHFFMSNFKIKKKVLKTSTFSIFRLFKKCYLSPENRYFVFFLLKSHFWGNF